MISLVAVEPAHTLTHALIHTPWFSKPKRRFLIHALTSPLVLSPQLRFLIHALIHVPWFLKDKRKFLIHALAHVP